MHSLVNQYPQVILKKDRDASVVRMHPWIFSGGIKGVSRQIDQGEIVDIYSYDGRPLATGHFEGSSIAVKILTFHPEIINADFWTEKIKAAFRLRQSLSLTDCRNTNAYRLVFTEGDGLPGLIVDFYNGVAVLQAQSIGMFNSRKEIAAALHAIFHDSLLAVYDKSPVDFFDTPDPQRLLYGALPTEIIIQENGHAFKIDVEKGQKTGFYIDQRDNRQLLAKFSKGRKVLNLFCYTGAFSVYALAAKADRVFSVDTSASAIEMANQNIIINNLDSSKHAGIQEDVKIYIANMDEDFGLVILDPPAFAKHQASRHKAMQGYRYLNETVLKKMPSGGILFTFSCSQVVGQELFQSTVMAAAIAAGRQIKILYKLTQSADHPTSIFHPEGEYLKGLVLFVE